jgi:hypothetical protein
MDFIDYSPFRIVINLMDNERVPLIVAGSRWVTDHRLGNVAKIQVQQEKDNK